MEYTEAIAILRVKKLTSLGHADTCEALDMAMKALEEQKEVKKTLKEILTRIDQEILKPLTDSDEHQFTEEAVNRVQNLIQSYL